MTARKAPVALPDVESARRAVEDLLAAAGGGQHVDPLDYARATAELTLAGEYGHAEEIARQRAAEAARRERVDGAASWLEGEAPGLAGQVLEARRSAVDALRVLREAASAYSAGVRQARRVFDEQRAREVPTSGRDGPVRVLRAGGDDGIMLDGVHWSSQRDLPGWIVANAALSALAPEDGAARRVLSGIRSRGTLELLGQAVEATSVATEV